MPCDRNAPRASTSVAEWHSASGLGHVGLTFFRQNTEDLIDFSFAIGGYENIEEVDSKGIEVSAGWNITASIALSADYAYIRAREADGTALRYLPRHSGDIALGFHPSGPTLRDGAAALQRAARPAATAAT